MTKKQFERAKELEREIEKFKIMLDFSHQYYKEIKRLIENHDFHEQRQYICGARTVLADYLNPERFLTMILQSIEVDPINEELKKLKKEFEAL